MARDLGVDPLVFVLEIGRVVQVHLAVEELVQVHLSPLRAVVENEDPLIVAVFLEDDQVLFGITKPEGRFYDRAPRPGSTTRCR